MHPELPTAALLLSQATHVAGGRFAPSAIRRARAWKSGKLFRVLPILEEELCFD